MTATDGVRDLSLGQTRRMSGADGGHQHLGGMRPEFVRILGPGADLVNNCFCSGHIADTVNVRPVQVAPNSLVRDNGTQNPG